MCNTCGCNSTHNHTHIHTNEKRVIDVNKDILHNNNLLAERIRGYCEGRNIFSLNIVSSPGAGKTTLLEKTIRSLKKDIEFFVIAGDQQTTNDAKRIEETGAKTIQINTGSGCHLDANMVHNALQKLDPSFGSVLMIENVGNLVCPALFDLGEKYRVVVISVTEGEDKPLKYPNMFESSNICIINKTDLLPHLDFDIEKLRNNILKVNHHIKVIELSAITEDGINEWHKWIKDSIKE
jgi:hydrogenase nickel incorporation protein HypB